MKKTIISTTISIVITISICILGVGCGGSGGGVYEVSVPTPITPPAPLIVLSSPALSHNRIFIGSPEGFLYAFDSAGNSLWSFDATASVNSSPAVSTDASIYFGSSNGYVYSLNQQGGLRWNYLTNGAVNSSPAIDHLGRIWIGSDDGHLYSFQSNGDTHFSTNTGAGIRTNPAVYGDAAVFVGNDAGRVISYDLHGQQRYSFTSGTAAVTAGPVVDSLANAYYGTADGRMISLDKDGIFRWSFQAGDAIYSSPAIDEQKNLFFGSDDHHLYALDQNGSELWRYNTGAAVRSSPALFAESSIIVGITNQTMLHMSTQGSVINTFATTSPIHSSPLIVNTTGVYIGHGGKEIHKIDNTQISQGGFSVQASQLPWSKYRGAANNPGRVECTTTAQILKDFDEFGPAKSWIESQTTGDLQSIVNDPNNLSGIVSKTQLTTYSIQANLYSTALDDDMVALIAAASVDSPNDQLHLILAARSGVGESNPMQNIETNWGLLYVTIDQKASSNLPLFGSNRPVLLSTAVWTSPEGDWNNFITSGSTVRIEKSADGISAYASHFNTTTFQEIDTNSRVHIDWASDIPLNRFSGSTSFGFAAYSQEGASYRDIILNGIENCAITP